MDPSRQAAAISVLEAATDDLMRALRGPVPDLEAAAIALRERETALRIVVRASFRTRPPDLNARLQRVLERDQEAAEHVRRELEAMRTRLADTRQRVNDFGDAILAAETSR